jgi:hexulose-6-phosphate isomerase
MYSIGMMQGRLTPRNGRSIQFFPFDNWQNEFRDAKEIGLNEIESIFDYDNYQNNPLWSKDGRSTLKQIIGATGIAVNFICADYFMVKPFFRCSQSQVRENLHILRTLISNATNLAIKGIEIPFVDNSSIKTPEEINAVIEILKAIIPDLEKGSISICLETDLNPAKFKKLLNQFSHPLIKANYDTGNSSGNGYDPAEELAAYGTFIGNIHIKDRLFGDGTVKLGTGSAQFDRFFSALKAVGYTGSFILQAARGEDGNEKECIQQQISFLKSYITKYLP